MRLGCHRAQWSDARTVGVVGAHLICQQASLEPQHQHVLGRVELGPEIRLKERATIFLSCTIGNTASIT